MNTDFIMSVGPGCRVAWHLREHNLRFFSGPFDWFGGIKLETIFHFVNQGNFNGFFENREYLNINRAHTRVVKDNTFNIKSLHDFPISIGIDEYYPMFIEIMNRRLSRCLRAFEVCNHITFMSYGRDYKDISDFLINFNHLYNSKELVFINIEHDESIVYMEENEENLDNKGNIKIKHIKFNDIHKNGNTKTNTLRWRGNCEYWSKVCSNISINNAELLKGLLLGED